MSNHGDRFKKAVRRYIESWNENIEIKEETVLGYRFVNVPRKIDLILRNKDNNRYLAIECKLQETSGTAYQKLSYTLDDVKICPVPTIIVFAGNEIKPDMKSKLIMSGYGVEVEFIAGEDERGPKDKIKDSHNILREMVYIKLGMDFFKFM